MGVYGTLYAALITFAVALSCCLKIHSLVVLCVLCACSCPLCPFPGATDFSSFIICLQNQVIIVYISTTTLLL